MKFRSRGFGFGLVEILIVVAIILILLLVMYGNGLGPFARQRQGRPDKKGETVIGESKYAAEDSQCMSDLIQIREAITIQTDSVEGTPPKSLSETKLPPFFLKCPVGGEPYVYDPQTGTVHCPHPGHENY